jgi:hypothetical protein
MTKSLITQSLEDMAVIGYIEDDVKFQDLSITTVSPENTTGKEFSFHHRSNRREKLKMKTLGSSHASVYPT